jgi:glycosyltransferase involved in cell wall biosynthesis
MKVLLLSRYERLGASSRLRSYQYLPHLSARGIEVTVAPFFRDGYLRRFYGQGGKSPLAALAGYGRRLVMLTKSPRYDLVWLEGEALPWLPAWVEEGLAAAGIPYVVDYDDALFHRYDNHRSSLVRKLLGNKIDRVMRLARTVIAGSHYLSERAAAAGAPRVEYLPTVIDLHRYPEEARPEAGGLAIGWMGSRTTAPYLDAIRDVLVELADECGARVTLVGAGADQARHPAFEHVPWTEDGEVAAIQNFDIGIMPLPDAPWERGKCGYKLIQYMGCGKPVVASPVGANRRIVRPGVNGFLASSPEEWRSALKTLARDRALRERLGAAGRAQVESEFCLAVTAPRLEAILREAAGSPAAR